MLSIMHVQIGHFFWWLVTADDHVGSFNPLNPSLSFSTQDDDMIQIMLVDGFNFPSRNKKHFHIK